MGTVEYSVLIIDDEPMARKGYATILENSNLPISDIRIACDGAKGLEMMKERVSNIVITDIEMPIMDGLDFCRKVSQKCPHVALVVVTGYAEFKYAKRAISYGVKDYILKPVKQANLIHTMEQLIAKFNNANQLIKIPTRQLEGILEQLERSLLYNQKNLLEEAIESMNTFFTKLELNDCIILDKKIKSLLLERLSIKSRHALPKEFESFKGMEKIDFYSWYRKSMYTLLDELLNSKLRLENNLIYLARDYIDENYTQDISLIEAANKTGLSPAYFSRLFKKIIGITFVQYRQKVRMEQSKKLLRQTNKSIKEITFDVGYNDVTNFIRSFKKDTGYTPKKYREMRIEE